MTNPADRVNVGGTFENYVDPWTYDSDLQAGAAGSGKSESVAVPLLLEFIRKGFAGIVYDFKFPALDNAF